MTSTRDQRFGIGCIVDIIIASSLITPMTKTEKQESKPKVSLRYASSLLLASLGRWRWEWCDGDVFKVESNSSKLYFTFLDIVVGMEGETEQDTRRATAGEFTSVFLGVARKNFSVWTFGDGTYHKKFFWLLILHSCNVKCYCSNFYSQVKKTRRDMDMDYGQKVN